KATQILGSREEPKLWSGIFLVGASYVHYIFHQMTVLEVIHGGNAPDFRGVGEKRGVLHIQRREDPLGHKGCERLTGDDFNNAAENGNAGTAVGPSRAREKIQGLFGRERDGICEGVVEGACDVADLRGALRSNSRGVRHELSDGDGDGDGL